MTTIHIIVAIDSNGGIGLDNQIPWYSPEELRVFKTITKNSILIMGRKTAYNVPYLHNRTIYCISKSISQEIYITPQGNKLVMFNSIDDAIEAAIKIEQPFYIAGGKSIYEYVLSKSINKVIHLSIMKDNYECDTTLDKKWLSEFVVDSCEEYKEFEHYTLCQKMTTDEFTYLNILRSTLHLGKVRTTRNGITYSNFVNHMTFNLQDNKFPLLTTKRMFFRGIVEELLFFLRGDTDTTILEDKKILIWNKNTCRKFLDEHGFINRKEGVMGPMYGYIWRFFGAPYDDEKIGPTSAGYDQLKYVIDTIKNDPTSRRIMMTTFNPSQMKEGVLPPCHSIIIQFYVDDGYLSAFCYNRSQDLFLGTPFNIASTSLLVILIANICNLKPKFLDISMGDCHIYNEHLTSVEKQLERFAFPSPVLTIPKQITLENLNELSYKDFKLRNYRCHPRIKSEMIA